MDDKYTLHAFRERTTAFTVHSLPECGNFETHSGLVKKIDANGEMRPFEGNTFVYILDKQMQEIMKSLQDTLYDDCGNMFAKRLDSTTCHMTLHDLKNGEPGEWISSQVRETREMALKKLQELKSNNVVPITLRTTRVFNMMNTSVVLGLEPVDDENCRRIMQMYEELHEIVPLSYELTPHVTLAYYKPGIYEERDVFKLQQAFDKMNQILGQTVVVSTENLWYQEFADMNNYQTVTAEKKVNIDLVNTPGELIKIDFGDAESTIR